MRQHRRAGEKIFIDYAGPTVTLSDGARAQVFVAAMAASGCVFACTTPAQRLEGWIEGMVRALHFYQGVPALVVPDKAAAVIAFSDRYRYRQRRGAGLRPLLRAVGAACTPTFSQGQGHGGEFGPGDRPLGSGTASPHPPRQRGAGGCSHRQACPACIQMACTTHAIRTSSNTHCWPSAQFSFAHASKSPNGGQPCRI